MASRGSDSELEQRIAAIVDARVDARVRAMVRDNVLRQEQAPRSLPASKLASGGASVGQGLVWNGTMWVPQDVATQAELDAHLGDTTAHDAEDIVVDSTSLSGTAIDVQGSLEEISTVADGAIPKSIGDAPGDLIGFSADNTPARIPAAPGDGYGFFSDTSQPGGVAWQAMPYHVISQRSTRYPSGIGTTSFVIGYALAANYLATSGSATAMFYLDPADWGPGGVSLKLYGWAQSETDPTDSTLTVALARVTAVGAAGTISSTTGSTPSAAFSVTFANALFGGASSAATVTTAGYYIVYFVHNVNPAQAMSYGYSLVGRAAT